MTSAAGRALAPLGLIMLALLALSGCNSGGSSFPELEPFPPDLEARLHQVRDTAAGVRGLSPNGSAREGQVAREVLRRYWEEQAGALDEDDRREMEAFNAALRLLHLIGPDDDLLEAFGSEFSEGTLGFYVPEDDRLALVAENAAALDGEDDLILAHEYVHSFQDAAFNNGDRLQKLADDEKDDSRTEYGVTISCLKEGDATLAMRQYGQQVYGDDWYARTFGASTDDEGAEDRSTPPFMERYFAFDYIECAQFVNAIYQEGGWAAVNALYDEPPSTTEQILHPDKYRSREAGRSNAPQSAEDSLGDGWKLLDMSVFGEFDVYNYVATVLNDELAGAQAAAGWGAGWISVYTQGGDGGNPGVLVQLQLDWDTSRDMGEFLIAYGAMVGLVSDGKWEGDASAGGPVRWRGAGEYGYVSWDERLNRVQIIVSSDESARESVAARD